jgi:hypothetical protein
MKRKHEEFIDLMLEWKKEKKGERNKERRKSLGRNEKEKKN